MAWLSSLQLLTLATAYSDMKKIKLFGDLQSFKPEWELDVATPGEALRAIDANRPGFLAAADSGEYVALLIDEHNPDLVRQVTLSNACTPWANETLVIIPRIGGDIPIVFVAMALAVAETSMVAIIATAVINIAISLAISAIANAITGSKSSKNAGDTEKPESKPSYIADGPVNVSRAGHPYPMAFGTVLCGTMVLSSRIVVKKTKLT